MAVADDFAVFVVVDLVIVFIFVFSNLSCVGFHVVVLFFCSYTSGADYFKPVASARLSSRIDPIN